MTAGQLIGLEYSSTSGVPDIYIQVTNASDSEGIFWEYNGTTYEEVTNRSPYYCYETPVSSGGTRFPPPPIVLGGY